MQDVPTISDTETYQAKFNISNAGGGGLSEEFNPTNDENYALNLIYEQRKVVSIQAYHAGKALQIASGGVGLTLKA